MIVTIFEGKDKHYVMIGSKDKRFREAWGDVVKIPCSAIYTDLQNMASWANNELKEEFLIEVG